MRMSVLVVVIMLMSACASHGQKADADSGAAAATTKPAAQAPVDRFEKFNRHMFSFNMKIDRWVLKPVAKGYDKITPRFVKTGVSNFFGNLGEVDNILNDLLQWKWKQVGNDSGRLLVNTTIGIGGLFDVARPMGMKKSDGEDFGQTLAVWGVKQGPFLVLPLLGPSTVRDGFALPVDWYADPVTYIDHKTPRYALRALHLVDTRRSLLDAEKLISGDPYLFIRDAYLQRREYLIKDGELDLDSGFDSGDEDF